MDIIMSDLQLSGIRNQVLQSLTAHSDAKRTTACPFHFDHGSQKKHCPTVRRQAVCFDISTSVCDIRESDVLKLLFFHSSPLSSGLFLPLHLKNLTFIALVARWSRSPDLMIHLPRPAKAWDTGVSHRAQPLQWFLKTSPGTREPRAQRAGARLPAVAPDRVRGAAGAARLLLRHPARAPAVAVGGPPHKENAWALRRVQGARPGLAGRSARNKKRTSHRAEAKWRGQLGVARGGRAVGARCVILCPWGPAGPRGPARPARAAPRAGAAGWCPFGRAGWSLPTREQGAEDWSQLTRKARSVGRAPRRNRQKNFSPTADASGPNLKSALQKAQVDKSTKMGKPVQRLDPKSNASPPLGIAAPHQQRDKGLTEVCVTHRIRLKGGNKLLWLKEHVLTQCKEQDLERRFKNVNGMDT
ncbi:hypothetical protein AAY473_016643 [Plecturocebus cupreus]